MIYGWGRKSKDWAMPDGRTLVCSYSYVSLMLVFRFVWSRKWHLIGRDRAMDVETNRAELERMYGQGNVPDIGIFERFGMFITGGLILGGALVVALTQSVFGFGDDGSSTAAGLGDEPVAVIIDSAVDDQSDDTESGDDQAGGDQTGEADADAQAGVEADADDDADGNAGADMEGDTADGEAPGTDTDTDADDPDDPADSDDPGGSPEADLYEVAVVPEPEGEQYLVSTNIANIRQGWSEMRVHNLYATSRFGELTADDGQKFVIVEFQLLGYDGGSNVQDGTFRINDNGVLYSPSVGRINDIIYPGGVINTAIGFTVPTALTDVRFEAGVLDPTGDGYQSAYEFTLAPGQEPDPAERYSEPDQEVAVTKTGEGSEVTGNPAASQQSPLLVSVLGATSTARVGPDAAKPGFKFVVVEAQLTGQSSLANVSSTAFRVTAEGEEYGPINLVNEILSAGEVWTGTVAFEIPSSTFTADLEIGVPEVWTNGSRTRFELSFG